MKDMKTGSEILQLAEDDFDLQPEWKSLERRLHMRKPRKDGPKGRSNLKLSEEDHWHEAGVYENSAVGDNDSKSAPDTKEGGDAR